LLPIAGSAALPANPSNLPAMQFAHGLPPADHPAVSANQAGADEIDDCCPREQSPSNKSMDDCASIATCLLTCCGFSVPSALVLLSPPTVAGTAPAPASAQCRSAAGSLPFRPPRA
jgi:hypothetical protein